MALLARLPLITTAVMMGAIAAVAAPPVSEEQVKAIFVYKLLKFVDWPDDSFAGPQAPLAICVVSDDSFADLVEEAVKSNPQGGRPVEVRRVASAAAARGCHLVYFGASERHRLHAGLESLAGAPSLTAGDTEGFAVQGCVLDFWVEASKLRFEVNLDAASRARLKMSSKLLSLAARVVNK